VSKLGSHFARLFLFEPQVLSFQTDWRFSITPRNHCSGNYKLRGYKKNKMKKEA